MKSTTLAVIAIALVSAGCTKKAIVANTPQPVSNTPSGTTAPARNQTTAAAKPAPAKQQPSANQQQARSTGLPDAVRKTLNDSLTRLEDALFDYDKSTIRPDATNALRDDVGIVRGILVDYPSQKLMIEGHADERGSEEYNMALGDRRARAAEDFLVSMGVSSNQLSVISFGKDKPVCTNATEECWQRNRRAHLAAAP